MKDYQLMLRPYYEANFQEMKRLNRISLLLFLLILTLYDSEAQIVQFSQYYASPTILGPSFAGLNKRSKAALNYRNQWAGIPNSFVTYSFAMDHYFPNRNSGIGLLVLKDEAGAGDLGLLDVGLMYTYDFKMFKSGRYYVHGRPGISFKYSQRGLDFRKLTFGDQITDIDDIEQTTIETAPDNDKAYLDAATSFLIYGDKFWLGVTVDHLLTPNQSLYGYSSDVPMLAMAYGGYKWNLRDKVRRRIKDESITLSFLYKQQGEFKQMDFGMYWQKREMTLGAWYRGMPYLSQAEIGYRNNDAVILLAGYRFQSLQIGYSYDITINSLWGYSGGSHEVSIVYDFSVGKRDPRNRKHMPIPCPGFYY